MSEIITRFKSGVVTGEGVSEIFRHANENDYALPAVNVVGTNSINAVLETAKKANSPVIVQFSNGGESVGLIPTRYPDTALAGGDLCAQARRTEWQERPDGSFVGLGQRIIATNAAETALMDIRTVVLRSD